MKDEWNTIEGPKALAYPHDASYSSDEKGQIAEDMEKAIAEFCQDMISFEFFISTNSTLFP